MKKAINISLYIKDSTGKRRFVGKTIDRYFVREFGFGKAVLWQSRELSVDKRAIEYVKDYCKDIIFSDLEDRKSFMISMKDFIANARTDNYGEGEQMYIGMNFLKKLPAYYPTRYVKESKELN